MAVTQHPRVTVVGLLKGGVGKTRLAMLAALYLNSLGRRVYVIDGDTVSQTAYDWQRDAKADKQIGEKGWTIKVVRHPFEDIGEHIAEVAASGEYDEIVADIGGGNRSVLEAALTQAHRFIAPVGADPSETRKVAGTWKSARAAAAESAVGGFEAYVVLSRTDHATTLPGEARAQLIEAGLPLCDTELRKRVAYQRAYAKVPTDFLDVPDLLQELGMVKDGAVI
ncbi:ParA family protein [Streptomyces sp. NBC_00063]|uniref:ParA family protein n=1 Tax=Streptomyces sp. NBC_00063 TaxID=2975638 RepID=UPI003D73D3AF